MKNEKKNDFITVRLSDREKSDLEREAKIFGESTSQYVRLSLGIGREKRMTDLYARIVKGKYGQVCEIQTDEGYVYHIGTAVYKTRNHLVLFEAKSPTERGLADKYSMLGLSAVVGDHPLLKEIGEVMSEGGNFDGPKYRAFMKQIGLDPDYARPAFADEDVSFVKALEWKTVWSSDASDDVYVLNELGNDLSELLRVDQDPDLQSYFECESALENWPFKTCKMPFQAAFDRIDPRRLFSKTPVDLEILFLPSWVRRTISRGYEKWANVEMWSNVQGYDGEGFPENFPSLLTGVVVMLEPHPYNVTSSEEGFCIGFKKVCNLARQRFLSRLEAQGVIVMSQKEAKEYIATDEAVYWLWKNGNQSDWRDPSIKHLAPRAPTVSEKVRWRFQKPDTPVFDKRMGQNMSRAA